MLLFDSHLDIAWNAREWGRDLSKSVEEIRRSEKGILGPGRGTNTVSLPELRHAEVGLFIGTLLARRLVDSHPPFVAYNTPDEAHQSAARQLEYYRGLERTGVLRMIGDWESCENHIFRWEENAVATPLGMILSMEGADPIREPAELFAWVEWGLRIVGPAHYGSNRYTHGTSTEGGLKRDGFRLLANMQQAGVILDITHLTDQAFDEAMDFFQGRILASHHNCRALVPGQRQLTDSQIRVLVDRQAVIGVAFDAWMLSPGWQRGASTPENVKIEAAVAHIDHICQIAGNARHVGIGSDLDGGFGTEQSPGDLGTIAGLQKLDEILRRRGYSETETRGIFHQNWIDFFHDAWIDS